MKIHNNYGYIYAIENDINSKLYIGRTLDVRKREVTHFSAYSRTWAIKAAIAKYGSRHFDFVIVEACSSENELNTREKYWIDTLETLAPFGYNLKEGGVSGCPSDTTRKKMSAAHRGIKPSDAHRQAIADSRMGHVVTEETRHKLRLSHTGLRPSLETRLKMSFSHKGKTCGPMSEQTRLKISKKLLGKKLSIEHRLKISQALLGNENAKK